jgi:hypothetical protein
MRIVRAVNRSRRVLTVATVVAAAAAAVAMVAAAPAAANNDPHRIYLAAAPFDLPASLCGFPVHVEPLVDKEYATVSTNPDGSTTYKVTGSLFVSLTNAGTGKTISANISGPGSFTFPADGTTLTVSSTGVGLTWAPNLTDFGAPSNIVVTAGPIQVTFDVATGAVLSPSTQVPNVLIDVCAALST